MPTVNGLNATKFQATPKQKVRANAQHGKLRIMYDEHTLLAELTANDIIRMGAPLPPGARIIEAKLMSPQLGSGGGNGELDMGWVAVGSGDLTDDPNGLIDGLEVGSALGNAQMSDTQSLAGNGKVISDTEEAQVIVTGIETTDAGIADKIQCWVQYVVD